MAASRGPVPVHAQANGTGDLNSEILIALEKQEPTLSSEAFPQASQAEIKAALDRLASRGMVQYEALPTEQIVLTGEGQQICDEGSHEWKVWEAVKSKGRISVKELEKALGPSAKIGQGNAFKLKWIKKDGDALTPVAKEVTDSTRELLQHVSETGTFPDPKQLKDYQKRKLVTTKKIIAYEIRKGPQWALEITEMKTDLTAEMLADGSWETTSFKPYNFQSLGDSQTQRAGALHPLMKVREEFRRLFFDQGFIEMPTARFVDSGFWNFDTLFVPQQHPARDLQDTFYVSDPPEAGPPGPDPMADRALEQMENRNRAYREMGGSKGADLNYEEYYRNVRNVHQDGAYGSIGENLLQDPLLPN